MSLSPNGEEEQVVDLHKLQPPNVDSESIEISAEAPRRILYSATGCYLGDFDDCYGLNFERIAVFDPQTHQLLFEEKVGRNATSIISPNGHDSLAQTRRRLLFQRVSVWRVRRRLIFEAGLLQAVERQAGNCTTTVPWSFRPAAVQS
jgi:hypothetical protein